MYMESDYWNALDKGREMRVDPQQIGISHGIGDVGEGLKANVFRGAKIVELGFMGGGKGSRSSPGGHTPESYGSREREEMRELAKVNQMEITTHASPNIGYAAGFREGEFREEAREFVLHEVERAIDFAADVGQGGPVVMHLGEFPRPLFDLEQKRGGEPMFKGYPEEAEKAPIYVVDKRTGRVQGLRRDTDIPEPLPAQEGADPWSNPKRDEHGLIQFTTKKIGDYEKEAVDKGISDVGSYIFDKLIKRQIDLARGEEQRLTSVGKELLEKYEQIEELKQRLENFKRINPDKALLDARELAKGLGLAPSLESSRYRDFIKDPFDYIEKRAQDIKMQADGYFQAARSQGAQTVEIQKEIENKVPIEKYGLQKSAETISRAALSAYEQEKAKHLKKPLWIAPENWQPEEYGSHPDEYRKVILASRKRMEEELIGKGLARDEAKEVAKSHIRGTFDIGHANFWYKYYQGSKKEFDQWLSKEVEKLTKEGIIGHVHLSDNFGYHDEHLSPGEGNAPIQRFVEKLKEHGYTGKLIAEPGGQKEGRYHHALTESWKLFGSPIYRIDTTSQAWTDIESSYFGRAPQPPNFIVGDYAPSKDWTLWSEVPLE